MAECPLAGKGRGAVVALMVLLLLAGCATRSDSTAQRQADATAQGIAGHWITVQRGDTLGEIARRADVPLERLQRFNPGVDATRLAVGQRLMVPSQQERAPSGGPYRYQIRAGDTFTSIARRFDTRASRIESANPGVEPTALRIGQVIQVPLTTGSPVANQGASTGTSSGNATRQASLPARSR